MSRCYTFPPPGYVLKESLIESIKGVKEEVKKDRKHKSKDKKRKERNDGSKKHRHHKRRRYDESGNAASKKKVAGDGCGLMNSEEKSCLTMEVEQQTSSSQNSCDSSIHRPKQSQPFGGRHNDSGEFVCDYLLLALFASRVHTLMVTLFLQICCYKFEELSKRINKDQKHQSSSLQRDSISHLYSTCANKDPRDALSTKLDKEKKTIPLKDVEKPSLSQQKAIGHSKLLCSKVPSAMEVRFLNLIDTWTPERIESKLTDSEDQEWWMFMKYTAKRDHHYQVSNQTNIAASNSMVWPTARFLPEVELHALPFTVPF